MVQKSGPRKSFVQAIKYLNIHFKKKRVVSYNRLRHLPPFFLKFIKDIHTTLQTGWKVMNINLIPLHANELDYNNKSNCYEM